MDCVSNSNPNTTVTVSSRSREFGLRLPTGDAEFLTARQAWKRMGLCRRLWGEHEWSCLLTYQGQAIVSTEGRRVSGTDALRRFLPELLVSGTKDVTLEPLPPEEEKTRDLASLEGYGYAGGRLGARHDPGWRVLWANTPHLTCPFPIARVYLTNQAYFEVDPYHFKMQGSARVPTWGAWHREWRELAGNGTLPDQLSSLALFALETGFHLHHRIGLVGPTGWRIHVCTWDLGIPGFEVIETCPRPRGPLAYQLLRLHGPGQVETVATTEK